MSINSGVGDSLVGMGGYDCRSANYESITQNHSEFCNEVTTAIYYDSHVLRAMLDCILEQQLIGGP